MKTFNPADMDPSYTLGDMVHFQSFANKDDLARFLAHSVANQLREAIAERGAASLVVSGGSTPKPFFAALKTQDVDWSKVWVTLADERWVDKQHADSNEKLVRENLLVDGMHFVPLKSAGATPKDGAAETEAALLHMPMPFDVVVLGMGDDGHTASLFPKAPELWDGFYPQPDTRLVIGLTPPEYAPHPRITLTLPALLNAKRVILHITGASKQDVYAKACQQGSKEDMPIRAVLRQNETPVEVFWAA